MVYEKKKKQKYMSADTRIRTRKHQGGPKAVFTIFTIPATSTKAVDAYLNLPVGCYYKFYLCMFSTVSVSKWDK